MLPLVAASAFHKGSPTHVVAVVACAAIVAVIARLGVRWRERRPAAERRFRLAWVAGVIVFQLFSQSWQNWPGNFDVRYTPPLHVCDVIVVAIPFGLLTGWRLPRTLLYFWGVGLSVFAFILPILREGPDHLAFWLFWIGHLQIFASGVYVVAVDRYRPRIRDVGTAFGTTCLYVVAVLPVDVALGVDYGNVGPGESPTSMLGPWPGRVAVLLLLEGLLFLVLWAPWWLGPRAGARSRDAA